MYSLPDPPCGSGVGSHRCLLYVGLRHAAKTALSNSLGGFAMRKHDTAEPAVIAIQGCWERTDSDLQPSHKEEDLKRTYIPCQVLAKTRLKKTPKQQLRSLLL